MQRLDHININTAKQYTNVNYSIKITAVYMGHLQSFSEKGKMQYVNITLYAGADGTIQ